ncbi:MAG: hypothetical protein GY821_04320 [Gammaproteobacteria bacterium]|nr:hypothetical protein [Gammaproteobacteria bacterium]
MISASEKRENLIEAEENLLKLSLSFLKNLSMQRQQEENFNDTELYKIENHNKSLNSPQAIRTAIHQHGQEIRPLEQRIFHAFSQCLTTIIIPYY